MWRSRTQHPKNSARFLRKWEKVRRKSRKHTIPTGSISVSFSRLGIERFWLDYENSVHFALDHGWRRLGFGCGDLVHVVRPVGVRSDLGTIVSKTFQPSQSYTRVRAGRREFWSAEKIRMPDSYVFLIRL